MNRTFEAIGIQTWLIKQCDSIGVKYPTDIQKNCIPEILKGKDCIGAAKTGSGKTLAFALPIVQKLCEDPYGIYALVLTATRELAYQISDQFAVIGKVMNLKYVTIVGGMDMIEQAQKLSNNPHIVVATPGRLADHIESCMTFNFKNLKFLVLDEADRLLGGQFNDQIKTIFSVLPKERQHLFFSATITDTLSSIMNYTKKDTFVYESPSETATVDNLEQFYVLCPKDVKDIYLVQVIRTYREKYSDGNIIIFTHSCVNCQVLSNVLNDVGFENVALHGMVKQKERLAALARFKSNKTNILVATDVASRGLDIPTIELVINHSLPKVYKEYIHRVGRTARAGRGGKSITLIVPEEIPTLIEIEKHINTKLTEFKVSDKEVAIIFAQISVSKSEALMKLDEQNFYEKKKINLRKKQILEGLDPDEEEKKLLEKHAKRKKKKHSKSNPKKKKLLPTKI